MNNSLYKYAVLTASLSSCLMGFADNENSTNAINYPMEKTTITPNANPVIQHGFDVFITADFLYWTGRLDNLGYANTGTTTGSDVTRTTGLSSSGAVIKPLHKMSPGFKAGIGFNLGHDGWDTYAQYTWLRTSASSNNTFGTPGALSNWSYAKGSVFNNDNAVITAASSSWDLHFNSIDWELGREYFISPHLILRPHAGLKGSWQTQDYSVDQSAVTDLAQSIEGSYIFNQTSHGAYKMVHSQHFWGVGMRAGLNASWHFNRNWSIFGDWALSALWSQFTNTRIDYSTESSSNTLVGVKNNVIVNHQTQRIHTLRPVLEIDLGLRWDYWFLDDDYRIRIQAAWEDQIWFDQNQLLDISTTRYGSLNLQGLTMKFRLDF